MGVGVAVLFEPDRPRITTHVEDRRHARAQVAAVPPLGVLTQLANRLLVGMRLAKIERIGSTIGPAGLRKVNVRVDEAGRDPHAGEVDRLDASGQVTLGP